MIETVAVLGGVILLAGMSALALALPSMMLVWSCLGLLALGFAVGVPAGLGYHVLLRRALLARGELPRNWYVQPFRHHELLDDSARARLKPWWVTGGAGFMLIMLALAPIVMLLLTQR